MSDPAFTLGARPLGYRLLGPRFAYLLHLRPAEWPICAAHAAVGWVLALGLAGALGGAGLGRALLGLLLWVVCLNGGTLAINSAFDKDEGDVAYLRRPPPPPPHLFAFGMTLMVGGLAAAAAIALPAGYLAAYAACLVMSVLYSVPPFRLKAVAGADWVINMLGFGSLTCYAGWALAARPLTTPGLWIVVGFCPLFAALYPLTQLYQMEEDARRGDRTLALVLGLRRSLDVALATAALAFACFARAGVAAGWNVGAGDAWRWAGLAGAALAWGAVLVPWRLGGAGWSPARHQRGMHLALGAWAVTDLAVLAGFGT